MNLVAFFKVASLVILLAACQSSPIQKAEPSAAAEVDVADEAVTPAADAEPAAQREEPARPQDLWERIRQQFTWQTVDNEQVARARASYLRQPNYLQMIAQRADLYLYHIVEEVERRGLPMELALLPMVESTLNPFATSPEDAAGLWQIMPATGRSLGLEQGWWYDGRRDVRASTRAALDYLEKHHESFNGDWLLALAAYNSGKGRVLRARAHNEQRGKASDYWALELPRETRKYVPRLIALTQIIAFPERYNMVIPPVSNEPVFVAASTGGQIEMARAAELASVEMHVLEALNPGQLRWATAPNGPQELLLPVGSEAAFAEGIAGLTEADRVRWKHYKIRRGDSLIRVARQFNTQVGLLREVNNIRGSMIRAGDTLMIPYGSDWASSLAMTTRAEREQRSYRVRRGDSLYRIAGKFKVSINDIIVWNGLDPRDYLQPGQHLKLYVGGS